MTFYRAGNGANPFSKDLGSLIVAMLDSQNVLIYKLSSKSSIKYIPSKILLKSTVIALRQENESPNEVERKIIRTSPLKPL